MKKFLWKVLGFFSLGLAYLGLITPGLPYSIFVVFAAYCFTKGSPTMERWIYGHKIFGPFLINWERKRVFPTKMKFFMLFMMSTSLTAMYFTGVKPVGILSTAVFMGVVAVWAWRFPGSVEEWYRRKDQGLKIGWLK